jgi:hypothetical protein
MCREKNYPLSPTGAASHRLLSLYFGGVFMNGKRGPPLGNQNARKHGFYSRLLSDRDKKNYREAASVNGLDEEITFLRAKIKTLMQTDPDNLRLFSLAITTLTRLEHTRQRFYNSKEDKLRLAIDKTLDRATFLDIQNL